MSPPLLADAVTVVVGASASLLGVLIGSGLTYLVGMAQAKRAAAVAAVVKADLALRQFNVTDLSFEDQSDRDALLDRAPGRLLRLESALAVSAAQDALATVRVQHGPDRAATLAEELDGDLSRLAQRASAWYALLAAHRDGADVATQSAIAEQFDEATRIRDRATERLAALRKALGFISARRPPDRPPPSDGERPGPPGR